MPIDERTFIVSNLHRDEASDANNEVTITLPDSIFSGKVKAINMKQMYIDYSTEIIGTSNYTLSICYPESASARTINIDIVNNLIRTDEELAAIIASSINAEIGSLIFQAYFNRITTYTTDIYRDNSDLLCSYTIFTNNNTNFILDFSAKTSIGPLIGFGNGVYTNQYSYKGGNIPPIASYEAIRISNNAYNTIFKQFNTSADVACKMDLYDSSNTLIANYLDTRDTTISLPIVNGYIYDINQLITYLTTEVNRYSSSFTDNPQFSITFDLNTYRFTITNDKNALFGIGFRFNRANGDNNYGSLHRQLGFDKRVYLGYSSISSINAAKIFNKAYVSEYLFVCSDLIKYNYDASLIVAESAGLSSLYESLFTIPTVQITNNSYVPVFEMEHRISILASKLAKLYDEDSTEDKTITFYLKLSSGRHIKLNTQWSIKFEIEYVN